MKSTLASKTWKQLKEYEDESVIALSISQGKIETRPSIKLDHDDPETKKLAPELQKEYRYVVQSETSENFCKGELTKIDDTKPVDHEAAEKEKKHENYKETMAAASRCIRSYKQQKEDIEHRLNGFKDNEYHGLS